MDDWFDKAMKLICVGMFGLVLLFGVMLLGLLVYYAPSVFAR